MTGCIELASTCYVCGSQLTPNEWICCAKVCEPCAREIETFEHKKNFVSAPDTK